MKKATCKLISLINMYEKILNEILASQLQECTAKIYDQLRLSWVCKVHLNFKIN